MAMAVALAATTAMAVVSATSWLAGLDLGNANGFSILCDDEDNPFGNTHGLDILVSMEMASTAASSSFPDWLKD